MNVYEEVRAFYLSYRGKKRIIGRSAEGRDIFAVLVGSEGERPGISQYGMHAREWITAFLALEHARRGVKRGGVWIVPLVNPDGALLVQEGLPCVRSALRRERLLSLNHGDDFSLWKANADGVDLNVNFPARWGTGQSNLPYPAPANYIGSAPLCAPESRALVSFTRSVRPRYSLSWHTKGEEIYWRFHQPLLRAARDRRLARVLSNCTGYPLAEAPLSAGGYKDWCVEKLKIPAFTVEAGSDALTHPLGLEAFPEIFRCCGEALFCLSGEV